MKDDRLYLIHIKECIERVIMYTEEGKDVFFADIKTQDAGHAQPSKSLSSPRSDFPTL